LTLAALFIQLAHGSRAHAAAQTYCVGGYDGVPMNVSAACAKPAIEKLHAKCWHEHNFVSDGETCMVCWDECDTSCVWDFLRHNRRFKLVDPYTCARLGEMHNGQEILEHVIAGKPATPPPPPPAVLEARLESLSPGPYTAGDKITLQGSLRDDAGNLRKVAGGSFVVTDAEGKSVELPARVERDGTLAAELTLPASSAVNVEFRPVPPTLGKGEELRKKTSSPTALKVEVCGYRAQVVSPAAMEPLVSGQTTLLRAVLLDASGKIPIAPLPVDLALELTVQVAGEPARRLQANSALEASFTLPPSPAPRVVRVSAGGKAGARVVCPLGEQEATISDLGLGFDLSGFPKTCYAGIPCRGTLKLIRPAQGPGRASAEALLADPSTLAVLTDTGEEIARLHPAPDDRYAFDRTYSEAARAHWAFEVQGPRGTVAMPAHAVTVRPALKLSLPVELDFGTVTAGTALFSACRRLDFSESQAAEEHRWELSAEGGSACLGKPVLAFKNAAGRADSRPLSPPVTVEALDPQSRWLDLCLEVPRCLGEPPQDGMSVKVSPLTPEFKGQSATVRLRWTIASRGFLACQGYWFWPLVGSLGMAFVAAGIVRPARFSAAAAVRVAGSEKGLRTASALVLRECPGAGAGFYRDARLGLHGDGSVNGRVRLAAVHFRAVRGGGFVLTGTGPLEVQERRTLKWSPVGDLGRGHVPQGSAPYRSGGVYFKVESA
jgi:hypothetical protein